VIEFWQKLGWQLSLKAAPPRNFQRPVHHAHSMWGDIWRGPDVTERRLELRHDWPGDTEDPLAYHKCCPSYRASVIVWGFGATLLGRSRGSSNGVRGPTPNGRRDSRAGILTSRRDGSLIPCRERECFLQSVQTAFTRPRLLINGYLGKAAGAWSWPFTYIQCLSCYIPTSQLLILSKV
jgi:hypothetical protein